MVFQPFSRNIYSQTLRALNFSFWACFFLMQSNLIVFDGNITLLWAFNISLWALSWNMVFKIQVVNRQFTTQVRAFERSFAHKFLNLGIFNRNCHCHFVCILTDFARSNPSRCPAFAANNFSFAWRTVSCPNRHFIALRTFWNQVREQINALASIQWKKFCLNISEVSVDFSLLWGRVLRFSCEFNGVIKSVAGLHRVFFCHPKLVFFVFVRIRIFFIARAQPKRATVVLCHRFDFNI